MFRNRVAIPGWAWPVLSPCRLSRRDTISRQFFVQQVGKVNEGGEPGQAAAGTDIVEIGERAPIIYRRRFTCLGSSGVL